MTAQKIDALNKRYIDIIEMIQGKLPKVSAKVDVGLLDAHIVDIEVSVSPAYQRWLAENQGGDVSGVIFNDQGTTFAPGVHAVQFILFNTLGIVKQLLEKGVSAKVAIGLLPEELAAMVHREYQKRYA
jgi:hypothetical protein